MTRLPLPPLSVWAQLGSLTFERQSCVARPRSVHDDECSGLAELLVWPLPRGGSRRVRATATMSDASIAERH